MVLTHVNEYVFADLMQVRPNYPPYAMEIVHGIGGRAVFAGNISQALSASPFLTEVLACDIDPQLVEFYRRLVEVMRETPKREDFLRKFDEMLEKSRDGRTIVAGPVVYVPFLAHDEIYKEVRKDAKKAKIHCGDEQEFLDWLRERNYRADLIDDNNVPEYVKDWNGLFSSPPLKEGGIRLIGKRNGNVYEMPDGTLHPGTIEKGIGGYGCTPPEGGERRDVATALERFGYQPVDVPIISMVSGEPPNVRYTRRRSKGASNMWVIEEQPPQSHLRMVGGTHRLFTFQYKA